jgi:hypothetical protein
MDYAETVSYRYMYVGLKPAGDRLNPLTLAAMQDNVKEKMERRYQGIAELYQNQGRYRFIDIIPVIVTPIVMLTYGFFSWQTLLTCTCNVAITINFLRNQNTVHKFAKKLKTLEDRAFQKITTKPITLKTIAKLLTMHEMRLPKTSFSSENVTLLNKSRDFANALNELQQAFSSATALLKHMVLPWTPGIKKVLEQYINSAQNYHNAITTESLAFSLHALIQQENQRITH